MTGKGHTWIGIATSIAVFKYSNDLGLNGYIASLAYIAGATAPDWLEMRYKKGEGTTTVIKHRTITHWFILWAFALWFILEIIKNNEVFGYVIEINGWLTSTLLGFLMGGVLHLLTDLPNPQGIPIITPFAKHRFSLNLWKSGKNEIFMIVTAFLMSLWYVDLIAVNTQAVNVLFSIG